MVSGLETAKHGGGKITGGGMTVGTLRGRELSLQRRARKGVVSEGKKRQGKR